MVKVLVSLDDRLLSRVDQEARQRGLNRSAYLSRLLEREFHAEPSRRRVSAGKAIEDLRSHFEDFGPDEDSTSVIRRMRDEE